jgi:DnaJ-class molecular chaperone
MPKKEKWVKTGAPARARTCPVCEGKGKINEKDENGNTTEIVCPICDGSGFLGG